MSCHSLALLVGKPSTSPLGWAHHGWGSPCASWGMMQTTGIDFLLRTKQSLMEWIFSIFLPGTRYPVPQNSYELQFPRSPTKNHFFPHGASHFLASSFCPRTIPPLLYSGSNTQKGFCSWCWGRWDQILFMQVSAVPEIACPLHVLQIRLSFSYNTASHCPEDVSWCVQLHVTSVMNPKSRTVSYSGRADMQKQVRVCEAICPYCQDCKARSSLWSTRFVYLSVPSLFYPCSLSVPSLFNIPVKSCMFADQ